MSSLPSSASPASRRDAIQQVIGRAAEAALVGHSPWHAQLDALVAALGEATGVSRCYVMRFHRGAQGEPRASQIVEWAAPGVQSMRNDPAMQDFSFAETGVARWFTLLEADQTVAGPTAALPPSERAMTESQQIQSIAFVPIRVQEALWGAIGFDDCWSPRGWDRDEIDALHAAARLIGAALHRNGLEARLTSQRAELERSEVMHRALVRHFPNGVVTLVDRDLRFVLADGQGFRNFGVDPTLLIGRTLVEGLGDELAAAEEPLFRSALRGHETSGRVTWSDRIFEVRAVPVRDERDIVTHALGIISDLTLQVRAEEAMREQQHQLMRTQRMEALGRLAGGIAHDFNNLLTVIGTSAELALESIDEQHAAVTDLQEVRRAAERGYLLTRQLLAFTRQQPTQQPQFLALNEVVTSALQMLQRVGGASRPIALDLTDAAGAVYADRGQLEQVLVNLVVNAIDATSESGTITVGTTRAPGAIYGFETAEALLLKVRDTGIGMDAATRARIFEPFFTTKAPGRGTGLGLATVFAIVDQAGGRIDVESAPGVGTTFTVALPRRGEEAMGVVAPSRDDAVPPAPNDTVLVVDDEVGVRASVRRLLVSHGYRVIEADNGVDALRELERYRSSIALVLTDVVMPELDGPGLAERLHIDAPDLPVVFMSGYARDLLTKSTRPRDDTPLIEKPFSSRELLRVVRAGIDRTPLPHSA